MSKHSDSVKKWRKNCKDRIIDAFGGACCICGYDKCPASLALHHLDPMQKAFSFGSIRANPKNWTSLVVELRKCVLVCNNCHGEIHFQKLLIPIDAPKFNEIFADYTELEREAKLTPCPICNKLKSAHLINCSLECAGKSRSKIHWDSIDLVEKIKSKSIVAIAEELNCSDAAVHKRLKKLGLK